VHRANREPLPKTQHVRESGKVTQQGHGISAAQASLEDSSFAAQRTVIYLFG
jgi:hypothetical protein